MSLLSEEQCAQVIDALCEETIREIPMVCASQVSSIHSSKLKFDLFKKSFLSCFLASMSGSFALSVLEGAWQQPD